MSESPEGYNVKAVEAWINENIESLTPPFEWIRLERSDGWGEETGYR